MGLAFSVVGVSMLIGTPIFGALLNTNASGPGTVLVWWRALVFAGVRPLLPVLPLPLIRQCHSPLLCRPYALQHNSPSLCNILGGLICLVLAGDILISPRRVRRYASWPGSCAWWSRECSTRGGCVQKTQARVPVPVRVRRPRSPGDRTRQCDDLLCKYSYTYTSYAFRRRACIVLVSLSSNPARLFIPKR